MGYRNTLRILTAVFLFFLAFANIYAIGEIVYEVSGINSGSNNYGGDTGSVVLKISQKYIAPADQTICSAYHQIVKDNSPANNIVLKIFQGGSTGDSGVEIVSVAVVGSSLPAVSNPKDAPYTKFVLPNCVNLAAGSTYWFTFEPSQPVSLFGNYRSAYRNSNEFSYSSMWNKNGFAFGQPGWQENSNAEWSLKLEGEEGAAITPVIIVPGILGTELYNGSDLIWPDLAQMLGDIGDEFIYENLRLDNNGNSVNEIGVGNVIEVLLNILPDYRVDIFKGLKLFLEQNFYINDVNLFFFPYDWRLDLEATKDLLKQKIEEVKVLTSSDKVDIIAHSMGGLVVKNYLNQYGKNDINKLIFVGTPHLGAPKSAKILLEGDKLEIPWLADSAIKAVSQNIPTIYELLANPIYFSQFAGYIKKYDSVEPLNYSETKNFLLSKGVNWNLFDNAELFFNKNLQDINLSGVDAYNIVGCKTATQAGYQYGVNNNEIASIKYASGDKTVPFPSADYLNISTNNKFYFKNASHSELPSVEPVRNLIADILQNKPVTLTEDLTQGDSAFCNFGGKELLWRSPVEVHIYDQFGNHTGPIENNAIEYGISGVIYDIIGHRKFIFLPTDNGAIYSVVANGLENGTFDLLIGENQNGNIVQTAVFNDVEISDASVVNFNVSSQSGDDFINLDQDGDGNSEVVSASAVLPAGQDEDVVPPETEISLSGTIGNNGWYKSDVVVTLNAMDDLSGVLETRYSLDNGVTFQNYSEPFVLSNEAINYLNYHSVDRAGNNELIKTIEVKIDKTTPEFEIQFNPATKNFDFTAQDGLEEVCNTQQCTVQDEAGNTTELFFEIRKNKQNTADKLKLKQISYNGAIVAFGDNSFNVDYKSLDQVIVIKNQERARVNYNRRKDISVVIIKEGKDKRVINSVTGLAFLNLFTEKGNLNIEIK